MNSMDDIGYAQKQSTYSPINNSKKSNGEELNINQTSAKIKNDQIKNGDHLDDEFNFNSKKSIIDSNHDLNNLTNNKISKDKFDVYSMPSTRLLSEHEKKFCNTIKLRPSQYLNLKTLILKVKNFRSD